MIDRYDLLVIGGGAAGINALKQGVKLCARVRSWSRGRSEVPASTVGEFPKRPW